MVPSKASMSHDSGYLTMVLSNSPTSALHYLTLSLVRVHLLTQVLYVLESDLVYSTTSSCGDEMQEKTSVQDLVFIAMVLLDCHVTEALYSLVCMGNKTELSSAFRYFAAKSETVHLVGFSCATESCYLTQAAVNGQARGQSTCTSWDATHVDR